MAIDEVMQYGPDGNWPVFFTEGVETLQERNRKHQQIRSPKSVLKAYRIIVDQENSSIITLLLLLV